MKDLLFGLQQQATYFPAAMLLIPGIALAICGLISWLAGIWMRSWISGILAAALALCVTLYFSPQKYALAVMATVILFVFAFFLHKGFFALFSAALVGLTAIIFLAAGFSYDVYVPLLNTETLTASQSIDIVKDYVYYFCLYVRTFFHSLSVQHIAIGSGLGFLALLTGAKFNKLTIAFGCAAAGAMAMFAAMVLLLIFKNSSPLDMIYSKPMMYLGILGGMIVFGTVEQVLFFSYKPKKKAKKDDEEEQGEQE